MFMIKFKKVLNYGIINIAIFCLILITVIAKSPKLVEGRRSNLTHSLTNKSHLRPPPATSSDEGRQRLIEALSEVTYHEHINKHIKPQAEALYQDFLKSKGIDLSLADNPENIALFYDSLEKYKDSDIAIMEIDGLYKNTRTLEHIGLGRFYGRPIIYIDKDLKGKEREEILQHAFDEITGWDQERKTQGVEWGEMRDLILANYQEFQTIADRLHTKSHNIDAILKKYEAKHNGNDLLIVIAEMPFLFKKGDVVIAGGWFSRSLTEPDGFPIEEEQMIKELKSEGVINIRSLHLRNYFTGDIPVKRLVEDNSDPSSWLPGLIAHPNDDVKDYVKLEGSTAPPIDVSYFSWLEKKLVLLHGYHRTAAAFIRGDRFISAKIIYVLEGSPQAVFNLLSNGQAFTRQEIADALGRKVRTILPDLRFLVSAGLLIQKDRGKKATYVINPELSKNLALMARVQDILDKEFEVLSRGWGNREKIREMIFEAALKDGLHFVPVDLSEIKITRVLFIDTDVVQNLKGFKKALEKLKTKEGNIPVIVLTEENEEVLRVILDSAGVDPNEIQFKKLSELGLENFDLAKVRVPILGIDNLSCIPLIDSLLEQYEALRRARDEV